MKDSTIIKGKEISDNLSKEIMEGILGHQMFEVISGRITLEDFENLITNTK